jgi:PAS domain-containing protein
MITISKVYLRNTGSARFEPPIEGGKGGGPQFFNPPQRAIEAVSHCSFSRRPKQSISKSNHEECHLTDRIRKVCIEGSLQFQIGELITLLDGRGPNETEASRSLASSNSACNSMRKGTRGMNPDRLKELGDRKVVESPFEDSEKRSVALLDSITDGFVGVSFDWRYTYANDSAARFLRRSKEQLIGEDVFRAFPEAKGTDFERGFRQALEDRVTTFFEAFYAPLESWFECRCYPSSEGMSVLFTDTTEKKAPGKRAQDLLRNGPERQQCHYPLEKRRDDLLFQ